jgi:hypothetical protein
MASATRIELASSASTVQCLTGRPPLAGWEGRIRTSACLIQNQMPCQLGYLPEGVTGENRHSATATHGARGTSRTCLSGFSDRRLDRNGLPGETYIWSGCGESNSVIRTGSPVPNQWDAAVRVLLVVLALRKCLLLADRPARRWTGLCRRLLYLDSFCRIDEFCLNYRGADCDAHVIRSWTRSAISSQCVLGCKLV